MMATLFTIEVNYRKSQQQADSLEEYGRKLKKIAEKNIENSQRTLQLNWCGDASNMFQGKVDIVQSQLIQVANDIIQAASVIRQVSNNTYNAEKRAWQLAQDRIFRKE